VSKVPAAVKRILVGHPKASGELEHTLLPKLIALPVFASDPLSSNAYATQEALLVLVAAGASYLIFPVAIAVASLLAIVVISYRQTVRAYPMGGGAYRVSKENLGMYPGLIAGAALLMDYVLTVAVSVTAGVDAIISAFSGLEPFDIELVLGFMALVTLANLRGAKESGTLFAFPTYGFVLSIFIMLGTGFARCLGGCPIAESAALRPEITEGLTLFLILKAFAAGTTALTGVEAIADGVGAFRYPQSRNAATTLAIMGGLSISMFLGISWLSDHTGVQYTHHTEPTVVSQIAFTVFEGGLLFYVVQVMSAAILILAANTAYQDFPRLSSILAGDRFMPRQFMNRGDRLVYSNGVLILSVLAAILVVIFEANLNDLIQLYLVGVFISFTLSQSGMVIRSIRQKPKGWQRTVAISGFGACVTGVVMVIVVITKFVGGAWIIVTALPIVVLMMRGIHRHYEDVARQLAHPARRPGERRPAHQHVVIYVSRVDAAVAHAIGYARSIRAAEIIAVSFDRAHWNSWHQLAPEIHLASPDGRGSIRSRLRAFLEDRRRELRDEDFLTVIVPETIGSQGLFEIVRHPSMHRLKASLLSVPGVQVLDIPMMNGLRDIGADPTREPARNHVVALVSGVHNATLQALEYAETLRPTSLRAVSFVLDPEASIELGDSWLRERIPHPLEIEDSPFRDIGKSLTEYVRRFEPDGIRRVVTVVIPEFVVPKKRHQILHGQTALIVKRHLLFERGVVVVSVPYHLD
jgi:amino acid transporter